MHRHQPGEKSVLPEGTGYVKSWESELLWQGSRNQKQAQPNRWKAPRECGDNWGWNGGIGPSPGGPCKHLKSSRSCWRILSGGGGDRCSQFTLWKELADCSLDSGLEQEEKKEEKEEEVGKGEEKEGNGIGRHPEADAIFRARDDEGLRYTDRF